MYSQEHKIYLKKRKREKYLVLFFQVFIVFAILFLWQFLADQGKINTFITSSPKDILQTIVSLQEQNNLWRHIGITIYETVISFFFGTVLGIFIASIFWWFPKIAKIFDPYLTVINSLPKVALGPILIIWIGANMNSIVIMALLISVIITIINVYDGFRSVDPNKINLLKSWKAKKIQIFFSLIFPANFPIFISALKINVSMSLIGV